MRPFGNAVILCGGKSSRMGFDKALLQIDGQYILQTMHDELAKVFDRVFLLGNQKTNPDKFSIFDMELVTDIYDQGIGPAGAIHTGLTHATSQYLFVIACDMPFINIDHIQYMRSIILGLDSEVIVPLNGQYKEVLYAFYHKSTLPIFEKNIKAGDYKMQLILDQLDTYYLDQDKSEAIDPGLSMFTNLNYPTDVTRAFSLKEGLSDDE